MKTYNGLQSKLARLGALSLIMGLMVSCGSYQNTSYYDNDGVYNNTPRQQHAAQSSADANYYSNYFMYIGTLYLKESGIKKASEEALL